MLDTRENGTELIVVADISTEYEIGSPKNKLVSEFKSFCESEISRQTALKIIESVTSTLLDMTADKIPTPELIIPIARAGIAMWPAANFHYQSPLSAFVIARKGKGTQNVDVSISTGLNADLSRVMLLDTVSATGDTLIEVTRKIQILFPNISVSAMMCYASPEAIQKTMQTNSLDHLIVAVRSDGVDPAGWLLPKIQGDAGDKLFGVVS